jgi:hypothetical protein
MVGMARDGDPSSATRRMGGAMRDGSAVQHDNGAAPFHEDAVLDEEERFEEHMLGGSSGQLDTDDEEGAVRQTAQVACLRAVLRTDRNRSFCSLRLSFKK